MTVKATVQLHCTSNLAESLLCSSPWHKQWHHPSLFVLDDSVNASMNSLGKGIIGLSLISLPEVPNNRSSIHDAEHEKQGISHRDVTISGQPALCSYISGIRNIMGPCLSPDCFFILVIFIPCFIRMKSLPSESSSLRTMRISDRNSPERRSCHSGLSLHVCEKLDLQHEVSGTLSLGVCFGNVLIKFCRHNQRMS